MPSAKTKTEILILGGTIITQNSLNKKRWYLYLFGCIFTLLFSRSVVPESLQPCGLQHARLSCPSPSPRACSNSCPLSQWCHPTISSSVAPFSSCLLSFPASGFYPVSQLFASGGQSIGASASASVLPMTIQGWFLLGLTGLILQSKGLARVFSNTTVRIRYWVSETYIVVFLEVEIDAYYPSKVSWVVKQVLVLFVVYLSTYPLLNSTQSAFLVMWAT